MGFATHAIALALGYALGNPEGRARLVALQSRAGEAAKEASRRPEVKQVRERAWDIAGEAGAAARNKLTTRSRREAAGSAPSAGGAATTAGSATVTGSAATDTSTITGMSTGTTTTTGTTATTGTTGPSGRGTTGPTGTATSEGSTTDTGTNGTPSVFDADDRLADDRLAGTTVAEDSKATVLGLATPETDRPEPPTQR